jgi:hypothetical protein
MTKEEFCDWLKTAKDGSKLLWKNGPKYIFDGKDTFNHENAPSYYGIDYIFRYPGEFTIVSEPRKIGFQYSVSNADTIFNTIVGDESLKAIIDLRPDFSKNAIKIKVTIEEVLE